MNRIFIKSAISDYLAYKSITKPSKKDDVPFSLPKPLIDNYEIQIEIEESVKFLEISLDELLTWKEHKKLSGNEITKNICISYKSRLYLDKKSLVTPLLLIYSVLPKLCKYSVVQH